MDEEHKGGEVEECCTLLEELLSNPLAPLLAELPRPAGVADIGTLQRHLWNGRTGHLFMAQHASRWEGPPATHQPKGQWSSYLEDEVPMG